jgi:hypothetical protein
LSKEFCVGVLPSCGLYQSMLPSWVELFAKRKADGNNARVHSI